MTVPAVTEPWSRDAADVVAELGRGVGRGFLHQHGHAGAQAILGDRMMEEVGQRDHHRVGSDLFEEEPVVGEGRHVLPVLGGERAGGGLVHVGHGDEPQLVRAERKCLGVGAGDAAGADHRDAQRRGAHGQP